MPKDIEKIRRTRANRPKRCTCGEVLGRPDFGHPWPEYPAKAWFIKCECAECGKLWYAPVGSEVWINVVV